MSFELMLQRRACSDSLRLKLADADAAVPLICAMTPEADGELLGTLATMCEGPTGIGV